MTNTSITATEQDLECAKLLRQGIETIERVGWVQNEWFAPDENGMNFGEGGVCAVGAIYTSQGNDYDSRYYALLNRTELGMSACRAVCRVLQLQRWVESKDYNMDGEVVYSLFEKDVIDVLSDWSEAEDRTQTEVVEALSSAAHMLELGYLSGTIKVRFIEEV